MDNVKFLALCLADGIHSVKFIFSIINNRLIIKQTHLYILMSDVIVGKLFCLSECKARKLKMGITILNLQKFVVRVRNNI